MSETIGKMTNMELRQDDSNRLYWVDDQDGRISEENALSSMGVDPNAKQDPAQAIWHNRDHDIPVTIVGIHGRMYGEDYLAAQETSAGIPRSELEWQTETPPSPTGDETKTIEALTARLDVLEAENRKLRDGTVDADLYASLEQRYKDLESRLEQTDKRFDEMFTQMEKVLEAADNRHKEMMDAMDRREATLLAAVQSNNETILTAINDRGAPAAGLSERSVPRTGFFGRFRGPRREVYDDRTGVAVPYAENNPLALGAAAVLAVGALAIGYLIGHETSSHKGPSKATITKTDQKLTTALRKDDRIIKDQQEELRRDKKIQANQTEIKNNQKTIEDNQKTITRAIHVYGNRELNLEKKILAAERAEAKAEGRSLYGGQLTVRETGKVFNVEFGHGIIQELQEYSLANGYGYLSAPRALKIYQGMRARFGTDLVNSANDGNDTYVRAAGDVGISRPGPAYWPQHVREYINSQLSAGR